MRKKAQMRILPDRMGFMRLRHRTNRAQRWPVTVIARIGAGGVPSIRDCEQ
jgi:hypothetical protein